MASQTLLVLVGLPGSGKTTVCEKVFSARGWVVINQDTLGDRRACENACYAALSRGCNVAIDRCNFNEQQRSHWVRLAGQACGSRVRVVALQLLLPVDLCKARARVRTDHPTLKPHNCDDVIDRFYSEFVLATRREGFEEVLIATTSEEADRLADRVAPPWQWPLAPPPEQVPRPSCLLGGSSSNGAWELQAAAAAAAAAGGWQQQDYSHIWMQSLAQSMCQQQWQSQQYHQQPAWTLAHQAQPPAWAPRPVAPTASARSPFWPSHGAQAGPTGMHSHCAPGQGQGLEACIAQHGSLGRQGSSWTQGGGIGVVLQRGSGQPAAAATAAAITIDLTASDNSTARPYTNGHSNGGRDYSHQHSQQQLAHAPSSGPAEPEQKRMRTDFQPQQHPRREGGGSWRRRQQQEQAEEPWYVLEPKLRAVFADPKSSVPYDLAPAGSADDPRIILLFDLNGTLTSHTSKRKSSGENHMRPGTHHLKALQQHFRLGIYTSSTIRTVSTVRRLLEEAAGGPLFEPGLILFREHTAPAPKEHVDAGGDPWDTIKPLARYFSRLHRVVLVDDDAFKALPGEDDNMLLVPCWLHEDPACQVLRLMCEALVDVMAPMSGDPTADVRRVTKVLAQRLQQEAAAAAEAADADEVPAAAGSGDHLSSEGPCIMGKATANGSVASNHGKVQADPDEILILDD